MSAPDEHAKRGRRSADPASVVPFPGAVPEGQRVPGLASLLYLPGERVTRDDGRAVLNWCPKVTRHLVAWSPAGEVTSRRVTIEVDGLTATVSTRDVADGTVWTDRFPQSAGVSSRAMREALADIVMDQAAQLDTVPMHPTWTDGRLVVPPADVLPGGYREQAGTVDDFRALVREAARSPRIALVMGLAVAGLYVLPLGRQSYVVHLAGRSSAGKTTTANAVGAIFGQPRGVVKRWNVTENGLCAYLRGMACMTAFRDEIGAAKFPLAQLESVVFRVSEGASRDVSDRTGRLRESEGFWHGALISTGNESIVERVTNEGVAARVIEFYGAALTLDREHADRLDALIRNGYGHGLPLIVDRALSPDAFAEWADKTGAALGLPDGGVERRVGQHLAMGIAGARLLGEVSGVAELEHAALVAAREALDDAVTGLLERGQNPGDRLLRALADHMASNPGQWPTRQRYVEVAEPYGQRDIRGWDLTGDSTPGEVAVLAGKLSGIADEYGITDTGIALRELRRSGHLLPQASGRHLARKVRVGAKLHRAYLLTGVVPDDEPAETDPEGPQDGPQAAEPVGQVESPPADDDGSQADAQGPQSGPVVTMGDMAACEACGRSTPVRQDGRPRHMHPCPPPAPGPAKSDTPDDQGKRSDEGSPRNGSDDLPPADPDDLARFARVVRSSHPDATDTDVAAAYDLFRESTGGVRMIRDAGGVGIAWWRWVRERNHASVRTESVDGWSAERRELVDNISRDLTHRFADYLRADAEVIPGSVITTLDVNGQYPAAAASVMLGHGEPDHYTSARSIRVITEQDRWSKRPGYVRLGADLPTQHPAFDDLRAGDWLALPTLDFLINPGKDMPALIDPETLNIAELVYWGNGNSGKRLAAWQAKFRAARAALIEHDSLTARYALTVLKTVANTFLGGYLRSERHAGGSEVLRRDWSDMLITQAGANMLRAEWRSQHRDGNPAAFGAWRDALWFVGEAPFAPDGSALPISDQLGKFKREKIITVTDDIAAAYESGSHKGMVDALAQAHRGEGDQQ